MIKDFLRNNQNTKVKMILVSLMELSTLPEDREIISNNKSKASLHSYIHVNLEKTDVKIIFKDMIYEMLAALANYQKKGSGWYFKEIIKLEIHIVDYKPMLGESYIKLPEFIKKKCNH